MALEIVRDPGSGAYVETTARLYRTASGEFVDERYAGPERKSLYCTPGQRILRTQAERDGLLAFVDELAEDDEGDEGDGTTVDDGGAESEDVEGEQASAEPKPDKVSAKDVRAWAKDEGIEVPQRGKLPEDVIERYREAQAETGR